MITIRKGNWLELIIPKEWTGSTIEIILKDIWQLPRGLIHEYRMEKSINVNGELSPWSKQLNAGDKLQIHMFRQEKYGVEPRYHNLSILYEDDHVLIVNKPGQMDTHPGNPEQNNTLANAIAYYFLEQGIQTKIRHIHRLDKDTTGAILFAKNQLAGAIMDRQLEVKAIQRTYVAVVKGRLSTNKGVINAPIGRDRHHATRRRVSPTGKTAITYYEVLEYNKKENLSLVKLNLETGRTHQIRVHMSHLGHPIIGDELYGGDRDRFYRQALHSAKISLHHPITKEKLSCVAPLSEFPAFLEYDLSTL